MDVLTDSQSTCASDLINSTITHDSNDTKVILHTAKVYGLVFGISLVLFCFLRQWFPRVYNVRNWAEKYQTPLAADQRGLLSWMWNLFFLTELQLRDECGMDAVCYNRIFSFGIKLSSIGIFHSIWLMPVYGTESMAPLIKVDDDPLATVSISNIPAGSIRFIATVVASYCIFFSVMFLMLRELEWFTRARHEFLAKLLPRNFTVYVQSIPEELRSNRALNQFFQEGLATNTVLSTQLAVTVGNVKSLQKKRTKVLERLQQEIDRLTIQNASRDDAEETSHTNDRNDDSTSTEVDALYRELREMNCTISNCVHEIEQRANMYGESCNQQPLERAAASSHEGTCLLDEDETEIDPTLNSPDIEICEHLKSKEVASTPPTLGGNAASHHSALDAVTDTLMDAANTVEEWSGQIARETGRAVMDLVSSEDGRVLPCAFVSFTTLRGTHSALQMVQYPEFYAMKVSEAPQPEDILWANVGRPHQELKVFSLLSLALTISVCLLWTVPMAFIASIANLRGLKEQFHWLDEILTKYPRLEIFFNQLAPLLILLAGQLMYLITEVFTVLEGPISGAIVQTRMFVKLYWFQIIQVRRFIPGEFPLFRIRSDIFDFISL